MKTVRGTCLPAFFRGFEKLKLKNLKIKILKIETNSDIVKNEFVHRSRRRRCWRNHHRRRWSCRRASGHRVGYRARGRKAPLIQNQDFGRRKNKMLTQKWRFKESKCKHLIQNIYPHLAKYSKYFCNFSSTASVTDLDTGLTDAVFQYEIKILNFKLKQISQIPTSLIVKQLKWIQRKMMTRKKWLLNADGFAHDLRCM